MHVISSHSFPQIYEDIAQRLLALGQRVEGSTRWQGQDIRTQPDMVPIELQNVIFEMNMPARKDVAASYTQPNLPWAEDHFQERVGGVPLNPPPSAAHWPHAQAGHSSHTDHWGQFSHTYPERFWPRHAGHDISGYCSTARADEMCPAGPQAGIRFQLGDLRDVVNLLIKDPETRQAYLPVWFSEDTGATQGQRVPCTLGYHFMIRDNQLHVTYLIRAVDFVRHFRDDVYMAIRLAQWVNHQFNLDVSNPKVMMGNLTMHTMSMHCFAGDLHALEQFADGYGRRKSESLLRSLR